MKCPVTLILLLMLLFSSCDFYEDRFNPPDAKPLSFVKDVGSDVKLEFLQQQDSTVQTSAINSKVIIRVTRALTDFNLFIVVRKTEAGQFKTIIRKQIQIDALGDGEEQVETLGSKLTQVFGVDDVSVQVVNAGTGETDYLYSGFYAGSAISYKNEEVLNGSLTDVVIDSQGLFDFELRTALSEVRFLRGISITQKKFTGNTFSIANADVGSYTGTITETMSPDSLYIFVALTNTTHIDTLVFKLKSTLQ